MRRIALLATLALILVACSGSSGRAFARYYDPGGRFSTNLPAANDITVAPPQPAGSGPGVVAGVIAAPPQPSPSTSSAFGGGFNVAQAQPSDQTIYEAFVVTTDTFPTLNAMTLYFLTSDPAIDVQLEQGVQVGGSTGRLVVANVVRSGSASASVAVAMSLGQRGTGYLVAAIFPPGTWDHERTDFLGVIGSFRPSVPPGIGTFPLASGPS